MAKYTVTGRVVQALQIATYFSGAYTGFFPGGAQAYFSTNKNQQGGPSSQLRTFYRPGWKNQQGGVSSMKKFSRGLGGTGPPPLRTPLIFLAHFGII